MNKDEVVKQPADNATPNTRLAKLERVMRDYADPMNWCAGKRFDPNSSKFNGISTAIAALGQPGENATLTKKVKVKMLKWVPFGDRMFTATASPIGTYAVEDGYFPLKLNGHIIGRYESDAEAKEAAQADYEARILTALEDDEG